MDPPKSGKTALFPVFWRQFLGLGGVHFGGPTHAKFGIESHVTIQNHERACSEGLFFSKLTLRERERERGAEPASRREPSLWSQQKGKARSDM